MDDLTAQDWKVIRLALETQVRVMAERKQWPAHEAAMLVRVKVAK